MREENHATLRRFWDIQHIHGAVNAAGVANSIATHCRALMDAGWGTDQINEDPAIRVLAIGLTRLCGVSIDFEQLSKAQSAANGLRARLEAEGHTIP